MKRELLSVEREKNINKTISYKWLLNIPDSSINSKFHFLLENEILSHFLLMIGKYSTICSKKSSTCYYK